MTQHGNRAFERYLELSLDFAFAAHAHAGYSLGTTPKAAAVTLTPPGCHMVTTAAHSTRIEPLNSRGH
ncbi:hypothetical protein HYPGJ_10164 [Hyphomicrobium sp. GJ21]|nr:hypothetical protein HYPGJ_10164 [Hyphomicrobium sp. GJ21]